MTYNIEFNIKAKSKQKEYLAGHIVGVIFNNISLLIFLSQIYL